MPAQSSSPDAAAPRSLAVIPARGGSKRLPRKNVLEVAGHPLIAHTIMAASRATRLTDWLVSSDDDEIIEIARRYGAPVPFRRPPELAGDNVRNHDTVAHALEFMEQQTGQPYDLVMLLQPTCPIRDPAHIDEAIDRLWNSPLDTLASVKGPYKKPHPSLKRIEDDVLEPWCEHAAGFDAEPYYLYNAAIYAAKRDYFVDGRRLRSRREVPLPMDQFHSADVDVYADLLVVEAYFSHLASRDASTGERT